MAKCQKVKNPCKICLGPVTQKTGLQCQGVCESWVHYTCLNYTPGRIHDIKAGVIKITCPCPDCKTTLPKEYRTDEAFSCNNEKCPANQPPRCENKTCPVNLQFPSVQELCPNLPNCPLSTCGTECKKFSGTQMQQPQASPCGIPNQGGQAFASYFSSTSANSSASSHYPIIAPPYRDIPGDMNHVYSLTSMTTVEQMCNTVGQLTNQINELMNKMKHAVNHNVTQCYAENQNRTCNQEGPKSKCPKPCFCPENPARKR